MRAAVRRGLGDRLAGVTAGVVAVAILALGAAIVAGHETRHVSTATLVVVGSPTPAEYELRSGRTIDRALESELARFGNPTVVADMLTRIFGSSGKQSELVDRGMRADVAITTRRTVTSETPDHGPVLDVRAVHVDPTVARDSLNLVVADLIEVLDRAQVGSLPSLRVGLVDVTLFSGPLAAGGSRPRSGAGFALLATIAGWIAWRAGTHWKARPATTPPSTTTPRSIDRPRRAGDSAAERRTWALVVLQTYTWLLALLPARLVFGEIGYFGSPASLAGLAAFATWAIAAAQPGFLVRVVWPVRVAVLAMWIPTLISYAVLHLNPVATDELNASDRWIMFMLVWSGVALLAAEGLRGWAEALRLLRVVVAAAAVVSTIALVQSWTPLDPTAWMARIPGLHVAGELDSVLSRSGLRRPAGTATHPLELGAVIGAVLGPAIALASRDSGWPLFRRSTALVMVGLAMPIVVSRSAIVGAAIAVAFWLSAADHRERVRGAAFAAIGFGVLFVTTPGLLGTVRNYFAAVGTDPSISTRTDDYAAVAPLVRQSPWIGRGPATYLPKFRVLDNQWLATLIETGVIGVAGLVVYVAVLAVLGAQLRHDRADDRLARVIAHSLIGITVVVVVMSASYDFYAYPMAPGCLALLLGVAGAMAGSVSAWRAPAPALEDRLDRSAVAGS